MPGKAGQTLRSPASSYLYAAIAVCQMGLAPYLTGASPLTHRFRLCDLEAGDFPDRLKPHLFLSTRHDFTACGGIRADMGSLKWLVWAAGKCQEWEMLWEARASGVCLTSGK